MTPSSLSCEPAPGALMGLARLMPLAFLGQDLGPLAQHMVGRIENDADDANAWMDLSTLMLLQGNRKEGLALQREALRMRRSFTLKEEPGSAPLRLLALMTPGDLMANSPLDFLVQPAHVALTVLYLVPGEPLPHPLPAHDLLIVAISQSEVNDPLLLQLEDALAHWPRPVLNRPARVVQTHREHAFRRLGDAPGVAMMPTVRVARDTLQSFITDADAVARHLPGARYPLIVRPVDSHAGHGLAKIDAPQDIAAYLGAADEAEFFVSLFVDYAGPDGLFRKCRVVLVDGQPFVAHMAVSSHWMVHYLNAGMTESASKRADEARFMQDFETGFAVRHRAALAAVHERLGLDYLVIDCAETREGDLLVFEVDPGAVVHSMDPVDLYPYKPAHMDKIYAAFEAMLRRRVMEAAG